jgi:3-oxoacid CoA-transferase
MASATARSPYACFANSMLHSCPRALSSGSITSRLRTHCRPSRIGIRYLQIEVERPKPDIKGSFAPKVSRGGSKLYKDADEAVADIQSGSTILSAGFGLCGTAGKSSDLEAACAILTCVIVDTLIGAIHRRGVESLHSLTAVSNNAGASGPGGLSVITRSGQVDRLILSYLGNNKALEQKYLTGNVAIELCPQGTLAERLRAAGAGVPAFFTPTGVCTCPNAFFIDI